MISLLDENATHLYNLPTVNIGAKAPYNTSLRE
jgi:hypothetical protein